MNQCPQIGKYVISGCLQIIWSAIDTEHKEAKSTMLSKKLKHKCLDVTEWLQHCIDRKAIFDAIEKRISGTSLPDPPSSLLLEFPKRSELIADSLSLASISLDECTVSDMATSIIDKIHCSSDKEIEWMTFIHYGELWFGGAVHAACVRRLIKHDPAWQRCFFPSNCHMESHKTFSSLTKNQHSHQSQRIDTITSWFHFGDYHKQDQLVQQYFQDFEVFLSHHEVEMTQTIQSCKEALSSYTLLANQST